MSVSNGPTLPYLGPHKLKRLRVVALGDWRSIKIFCPKTNKNLQAMNCVIIRNDGRVVITDLGRSFLRAHAGIGARSHLLKPRASRLAGRKEGE